MLRTFPISIYTQSIVHAELCLHKIKREKKVKKKKKVMPKLLKWHHTVSQLDPWCHRSSGGQADRATEGEYLYASPGPITAPSNRLFTTVGGGMSTQILVYMQILWTAREDDGGGIKMKHFTEIKNKKRHIILYKKFCTRPSLRCHHLYKFCKEREKGKFKRGHRKPKLNSKSSASQNKDGDYLNYNSYLHNWPDHLHQCLLL